MLYDLISCEHYKSGGQERVKFGMLKSIARLAMPV